MASDDEYKQPITQTEGSGKLDRTFGDGVGEPSPEQPVLPSGRSWLRE